MAEYTVAVMCKNGLRGMEHPPRFQRAFCWGRGDRSMISERILSCVCLLILTCSAVYAQRETPAGAGDKDLSDRGVKNRSSDLERVTRDAKKQDPAKSLEAVGATAKFEEIKEDFENLQRRQDEIVKAYTAGKQIDIEKIAQLSDLMNKNAVRLEANLFPVVDEKKGKKKSRDNKVEATSAALPQDLKSLIVEQDNGLASFVGNPMFVNPQAANGEDNAKAHADLKKLIRLSAALRVEAEKRPN